MWGCLVESSEERVTEIKGRMISFFIYVAHANSLMMIIILRILWKVSVLALKMLQVLGEDAIILILFLFFDLH